MHLGYNSVVGNLDGNARGNAKGALRFSDGLPEGRRSSAGIRLPEGGRPSGSANPTDSASASANPSGAPSASPISSGTPTCFGIDP